MPNRALSVHAQHELLLRLEEAGLTSTLAQAVIESKGNALAVGIVNLIKVGSSGRSVNVADAKEIVGTKNFFGPDEISRFFNGKFTVPKVPRIPWDVLQLMLSKDHFLFLLPSRFKGKPLTLSLLFSEMPRLLNPDTTWLNGQEFTDETEQHGWYLMSTEYFTGADTPPEYKIPSALSRVIANIFFRELNDQYMDETAWVKTIDSTNGGSEVWVRASRNLGMEFYKPVNILRELRGTALTRIPSF